MFKLAVVGPILSSGLGVARQCVNCRHLRTSPEGDTCFGFGPGCLHYQAESGAEATDTPAVTAPVPPRR